MIRKKIKRNRAQCLGCGDILESMHRHHFNQCQCGKTFVDGGKTYLRRGYSEKVGFKELSTYVKTKMQTLLEKRELIFDKAEDWDILNELAKEVGVFLTENKLWIFDEDEE